jgi:uncharacterized repeat protein (TIGR03943 family)
MPAPSYAITPPSPPPAARPRPARPGGVPVDLARGGLLLALGGMLLLKVADGAITYYIRPDLAWTLLLAAVGLLVVGAAHLLRWAIVRPEAAGWRATLAEAALLAPLIAGLAAPARPLDSAALAQRGLNTYAAPAGDGRLASLNSDTSQWTLLDWTTALAREADPARLHGRPVALIGFAYPGDRALRPGEFSVVRFVVTCCAADGSAVGLPVRAAGPPPPRDAWVRVIGVLEVSADAERAPRAVIAATAVEPIERPPTPYLYP